MKLSRAHKIRGVWDAFDESEPGISTEQLFARVSDKCNCDPDDIVEALAVTEDEEQEGKESDDGP